MYQWSHTYRDSINVNLSMEYEDLLLKFHCKLAQSSEAYGNTRYELTEAIYMLCCLFNR